MTKISDELRELFGAVAKMMPGVSSRVIVAADWEGAIEIAQEQKQAHQMAVDLFGDFIQSHHKQDQDFDADQDSLLDDPLGD